MSPHIWSRKDTFELIKHYKASMLWDSKHLHYRDKRIKREITKNIALAMNTSPKEIIRKLHNLRCQLRQEIKKLKNYMSSESKIPTSSWSYFSAMKFLLPTLNNTCEKLMKDADFKQKNTEECENLEKIEERYETIPTKFLNDTCNEESKHSLIFLPKFPDEERNTVKFDEIEEKYEEKNSNKYVNINYDEELRHSLRIVPKDEDDRFGEYVALELRSLRSDANKRRLKSEIRRAICHIVDFDDATILNSSVQSEPLFQYSPSSPKYSQICKITNVKSENA